MTRTSRTSTIAAVAGGLALVLPAAASAAAPVAVTNGTTTLRPTGAALRTLTRAGVTVAPIGVAARSGSRIAIPMRSGSVGTVSQLAHGATDGLLLSGDEGRARLTDLRIRIGRSASTVKGRIDGRPLVTLFTLDAKRLDVRPAARAASRKNVTWRLTATAARDLRARLGVRGLRQGGFAVATLTAKLAAPAAPAPTPTAPAAPTPAAPGVAVSPRVVSGVGDWGVKASFRRYVTGPFAGGRIVLSDGTTTNADGTYRFAPPTGTVDRAGGALAVGFRGTVYFEGHGSGELATLRVWIRNPRVVTTPGSAVGTLHANVTSKGQNGTISDYPDVALATLDLTRGTRQTTDTTVTWNGVPATLTEAGVPAFGGFYNAGTELDPVAFSVATG